MIKNFIFGLFKIVVYFFIFIVVFIVIYFTALEMRQPDTLYFKTGEITGNEYIELSPSSNWYTYEDKNWTEDENGWGFQRIFFNDLKGVSYTLNFRTRPVPFEKDISFNKDADYTWIEKTNNVFVPDEIDIEQGITYSKGWLTYIQGIKCIGGVFSRGFKGSDTDGTTKNYNIECGYYDKTVKEYDGRRIFNVKSFYNYSGKDIRLQKDKYIKDEEIPTRTYIENILKNEIKNLVKTIKIKNLDIKRMEKEGLMHYEKEFKSTKW